MATNIKDTELRIKSYSDGNGSYTQILELTHIGGGVESITTPNGLARLTEKATDVGVEFTSDKWEFPGLPHAS